MEHQDQNFRLVCCYIGKFRVVLRPQIPNTGRIGNLRKNRLLSSWFPVHQYNNYTKLELFNQIKKFLLDTVDWPLYNWRKPHIQVFALDWPLAQKSSKFCT
jgi:hypothetical protein